MSLIRRDKSYSVRLSVPRSVQDLLGRSEVVRALNTDDPLEARTRGPMVESHLFKLFAHLRRYGHAMNREEIDKLAAEYLDARLFALEAALAGRTVSFADRMPENVAAEVAEHEELADLLSSCLADNDLRHTLEEARRALPSGSPESAVAVLARRYLEARLEVVNETIGALQGKPLRRVAMAPGREAPKKATGPTLKAFAADYVKRQIAGGHWAPRTARGVPSTLAVVVELIGPDKPVSVITKQDMLSLHEALGFYPKNANKKPATRGKSPREIVDMVKASEPGTYELLSNKSRNDYLLWTRTLLKEAVAHDLLDKSPASVLKDWAEKDSRTQRPPFTAEQRDAFLRATAAARESDPAVYWAPRIMILAGLRLEEMAKLRPADIREQEGVLVFSVNEENGRNKTESSTRVIPVHPSLVKLGLLKWRDKIASTAGSGANLWGLSPGRDGQVSGPLSKRLATRRKVAKLPPKVVTESARNTFSRELARAGVPDRINSELMGHSIEGDSDAITKRYIGFAELQELAAHVAKLPGIEEDAT